MQTILECGAAEVAIRGVIEAIDPKWQGALPYTIIIEPGGKVIYAKEGAV